MQHSDSSDAVATGAIKTQNDKRHSDEFSKLKNLALELKNMQLQLLKDLNPNILNKNGANHRDIRAINPNIKL